MAEVLGMIPGSSVIYIAPGEHQAPGIDPERYVHEYEHWHLVLQPEENRLKRGLAAGLIIVKREIILVTQLNAEEWADLSNIMADAPRRLCEYSEVTFTGHFVGPAFNNGNLSGQTQAQVHGHIYPVIEEELPKPHVRGGIESMIEAQRKNNNFG